MAFDRAEIYIRSIEGEFWQGEILSDLIEYRWAGPDDEATYREHPLAVILSADCDLTKDHDSRSSTNVADNKLLPNVLLCDLFDAEQLEEAGKKSGDLNSRLWRHVQSNSSERYHYLADVPAGKDSEGVGFGAMGIDFKCYFCVSTEHLVHQALKAAKRRCRLSSPFAQHLTQRFFAFQSRIGLPVNHHVKDSSG